MRKIILVLLALVWSGLAYAQLSGGMMFPGPGTPAASGGGGSCVPGGPTGQMDFSVCSNIGITAALF